MLNLGLMMGTIAQAVRDTRNPAPYIGVKAVGWPSATHEKRQRALPYPLESCPGNGADLHSESEKYLPLPPGYGHPLPAIRIGRELGGQRVQGARRKV